MCGLFPLVSNPDALGNYMVMPGETAIAFPVSGKMIDATTRNNLDVILYLSGWLSTLH